MNVFKNKWMKVGAIITGTLAAVYLAFAVPEMWRSYQWQKSVEKFQSALEKPYREDVYGGKTPEETWAMFLDALKKGDVELASKYFVVDKQEEMKEKFVKSIELDKMDRAIETFSKNKLVKEKSQIKGNRAYYYIPIENSDKEAEAYPVVFYFNPYTKLWKITTL